MLHAFGLIELAVIAAPFILLAYYVALACGFAAAWVWRQITGDQGQP
jgi:hypothetical protein